jgi:hypothetical protein
MESILGDSIDDYHDGLEEALGDQSGGSCS